MIPWAVGVGMLLGFAAEFHWHGNVLWMTRGGLVAGLVGAICDTVLFFYRRIYRRLKKNPALLLHRPGAIHAGGE